MASEISKMLSGKMISWTQHTTGLNKQLHKVTNTRYYSVYVKEKKEKEEGKQVKEEEWERRTPLVLSYLIKVMKAVNSFLVCWICFWKTKGAMSSTTCNRTVIQILLLIQCVYTSSVIDTSYTVVFPASCRVSLVLQLYYLHSIYMTTSPSLTAKNAPI